MKNQTNNKFCTIKFFFNFILNYHNNFLNINHSQINFSNKIFIFKKKKTILNLFIVRKVLYIIMDMQKI